MLLFNKNDLNCSARVWVRYKDMLSSSSKLPLYSVRMNFALINNFIDSKGLSMGIILLLIIFNEILFYKKNYYFLLNFKINLIK